MKKNLKKVLAAGLAASMVMSMTAFANTTTPTYELTTPSATYDAIIKAYTVNGSTDNALYPTETLTFESTPANTNPDPTKNLTIANLEVNGNAGQKLTITVPSYNKVGTYHYAVKEVKGNSQGVEYDINTEIAVSVLVEYDYEDAFPAATESTTAGDGHHLKATVGITKASSDGSKNSTITNIYNVGSLAVSKTVTGNLGDTDKYFDVEVTFTSDQPVESKITVSGGSNTNNITEIAETDWNKKNETEYVYNTTIKLRHSDTLTFNNIPDGVCYTVVESEEYSKDTNKNGENGYDAPVYANSDNKETTTGSGTITTEKSTTDGNVTYTPDNDTVGITNNKTTTVDTGISLDNMPYLMALALTFLGGLGFISKKRKEEELF